MSPTATCVYQKKSVSSKTDKKLSSRPCCNHCIVFLCAHLYLCLRRCPSSWRSDLSLICINCLRLRDCSCVLGQCDLYRIISLVYWTSVSLSLWLSTCIGVDIICMPLTKIVKLFYKLETFCLRVFRISCTCINVHLHRVISSYCPSCSPTSGTAIEVGGTISATIIWNTLKANRIVIPKIAK